MPEEIATPVEPSTTPTPETAPADTAAVTETPPVEPAEPDLISTDTDPVNISTQAMMHQTPKGQEIKLEDIIPQEYKDRHYLSKIKDVPDLFKSFDNAQDMIGKKIEQIIPKDDSPDEVWSKFWNLIGRPVDAGGYDFKLPEDLPKELEADETQMTSFKEAAHKMGLTDKQAQAVIDFDVDRQRTAYDSVKDDLLKSQANLDKEFDDLGAKAFGDRFDDVVKNTQELLKQYAPKDMVQYLEKLDNPSLITLSAVLDGISKDYIKEDVSLRAAPAAQQTADQLREEATKLIASDVFRNASHPDNYATRKKVQELFELAEKA